LKLIVLTGGGTVPRWLTPVFHKYVSGDVVSNGGPSQDLGCEMPTVLEIEGFRFFFYSADRNEPPHIHIRKAGKEAKFWLNPIRLVYLGRFKQNDLRRMIEILEEKQEFILERWHGQFDS
jgi:hypothetical protein